MAANKNNQVVERQQMSPGKAFRQSLEGPMRNEIARQLPKGIDPDRFIRTAITSVQMNPDLLDADRRSLMGSLMMAAKDGLLPDGREATIQVYNTKIKRGRSEEWVKMAQYMPMVGGLIAKMYDAGATFVDAAAVYERDHFRFARGDNPKIEHEPYLGAEEPGEVIAAYAIIKLGNGETKREVMAKRDIEKVRAASKASNGPGWTNWYDQFAIKAVLKRAYKQLPHSDTLQRIIEHDNEAMGFEFGQRDGDTSEVTGDEVERKTPGQSARLKAIVNNKRKPKDEDDATGIFGDVPEHHDEGELEDA